jgi:hypothetical protein
VTHFAGHGEISLTLFSLIAKFQSRPQLQRFAMTVSVKTHVTYRPKKGKEQELLALIRKHGPALESTGLIVGGQPDVYRARNVRTGETAFIEIFSWRDDKASSLAHQTPEVMAVWEPMTPMLELLEINVIEPIGG